jgi:hypothetical protein
VTEADLRGCADEPIRIPGAVQPHGVLLAVTCRPAHRGPRRAEPAAHQRLGARRGPGRRPGGGLLTAPAPPDTDDVTVLALGRRPVAAS